MEASQLPAEMAPGQEPADAPSAPAAPAPEAQAPAQPDGVTALQQQLNDLAPSLESLRAHLESAATPQDPAGEQPAEVEPPDLGFMSPEQPDYDPDAAAQLLGQVIDRSVQERIQVATSPLQERLQDMQLDQEARELAAEYPELESEEAITRVFSDAEKYAGTIGQSIGNSDLAQALAGSVPFARLVYMAGRAAEEARAEAQPDVRTATLLGAGGAGPAGAPGGGNVEDALLAGARRNPLPFS